MSYADYDYYQNTFMGSIIEPGDFPRLSMRASQFIDYYTMGRAAEHAELDAVKMCCCELAEKYQVIDRANKRANTDEIKSESVGSYSVTYLNSAESANVARADLARIVREYLLGTGLLYRGGNCVCSPCCDSL